MISLLTFYDHKARKSKVVETEFKELYFHIYRNRNVQHHLKRIEVKIIEDFTYVNIIYSQTDKVINYVFDNKNLESNRDLSQFNTIFTMFCYNPKL